MKFVSFLLALLLCASFSAAREYVDLVFSGNHGVDSTCVAKYDYRKSRNIGTTVHGLPCMAFPMYDKVRIRVLNPRKEESQRLGFKLVRPFLIIDGIYLSTDGTRTLSAMQDEVERFGIVDPLVELGYTPVLVQFPQTVRTSLPENSKYFSMMLHLMNSEYWFGFDNKMQDGFVVLGVSQGGILGRYGSYLYDIERNKAAEAPIRMYSSLDSPHQGAILPLGLFYTIDFWALDGGSGGAEAFRDLINGPGASGLLLYERMCKNKDCTDYSYEVNASPNRFLFGEYRKAAEYKGFPSVLISQGQLKGTIPAHSDTFFVLNRRAKKFGSVFARTESRLYSYLNGKKPVAQNRLYIFPGNIAEKTHTAQAFYDFIQGSTYPFAETMYKELHKGMYDGLPDKAEAALVLSISSSWDEDSLIQKNSTFIPTTSAMDLKCSGINSITEPCAFYQNYSGFPFTNPGAKSSANAVYAVDATHPRYNEPISGRHIELPSNMKADSAVISGLQVDMWRVLCELANYDYDYANKEFRNENLAWYFKPGTNCMDQTKMPEFLRKGGYVQKKYFAYGRYDYNGDATESDKSVTFDVPAGWHKVAVFDNGEDFAEGASVEFDITVNNTKGSWMKAELLLLKSKSGAGQLQLQEVSVPVDGKKHNVHWKLPANEGSLKKYHWIRLVLNSDGGNVTVANPILTKTIEDTGKEYEIAKANLYPEAYKFATWTSSASVDTYLEGANMGAELDFQKIGGEAYLTFNGEKSFEAYKKLQIYYWPGSCQGTGVYFDSFLSGMQYLNGTSTMEDGFVVKEISISDILDTKITQNYKKIASRLVFRSGKTDEVCLVYRIWAK